MGKSGPKKHKNTPFRLTPFEQKICELLDLGMDEVVITDIMGLKRRSNGQPSPNISAARIKRMELNRMVIYDERRPEFPTLNKAKNRGRSGRFD